MGVILKATDLLKRQHREVRGLFKAAKKAKPAGRREAMKTIAANLSAHMQIEEDIFYPAVKALDTKKVLELVPEAYEEHHVVALVLQELPSVDPDDERFEAKMTVLAELIEHHVKEEEQEMFSSAQRLGADRLAELGTSMKDSYDEVLAGNGRKR
jgi:Hemerythrin HHE cation binding domain